jgi:Flp pilus assembly protein TadG
MKEVKALRRSYDQGVAAVEMAIVLPLLVFLAFGIIDVGRVLFTHIAVQEATQEGALYGSFSPNDPTAVRQRVIESLESPVLDPGDIAVTCPSVDRIAVAVTHDVQLLTPIASDWFGGSFTLTKTVTGHVFSQDACVPSL